MSLERQILFWAAALAALWWLLHLLGSAVTPFAAGIALGYLLDPVVRRLERIGLSRLAASLLILVVFILVVVLVLVVVAPILGNQLIGFTQKLPGYVMRLQALAVDEGNALLERYGGRMARFPRARQYPLGRTDSKVGRRFRRAGRAMAAQRGALARLRRRGDRQFLLVPHRHAGRRLLHPRRLEQDDRRRSTAGCRSTIATRCARSPPRSTPRSPASFAASRWSACSSACGTESG